MNPVRNPSGNILITGGTGFLGRSILHVAESEQWDARFTILSRDDAKQRALRERFPDVRCVLGDVRELESLERSFWGKDLVIHAAAFKYIPQAEQNPNECISVNVLGSRNVCLAALYASVPHVIGISTDKACRPINVYGASKFMMERIFTDYNKLNKTIFSLVRYGNVVGSTGSVIPLFQQQLREGKKLTVTNPSMTRFWLSHQEAVNIIKRGLAAERFANIIPECRSMSVYDLALAINGGLEVVIVGARSGEKMHEELLHPLESHQAEGVKLIDAQMPTLKAFCLWMDTKPEGFFPLPRDYSYTSDLAHGHITASEMKVMIKESSLI